LHHLNIFHDEMEYLDLSCFRSIIWLLLFRLWIGSLLRLLSFWHKFWCCHAWPNNRMLPTCWLLARLWWPVWRQNLSRFGTWRQVTWLQFWRYCTLSASWRLWHLVFYLFCWIWIYRWVWQKLLWFIEECPLFQKHENHQNEVVGDLSLWVQIAIDPDKFQSTLSISEQKPQPMRR